VSSEQGLEGKLFVQFVALIFLSHITRKMQEGNLFKDYTLQEVLDELDVIECFELRGSAPRWAKGHNGRWTSMRDWAGHVAGLVTIGRELRVDESTVA